MKRSLRMWAWAATLLATGVSAATGFVATGSLLALLPALLLVRYVWSDSEALMVVALLAGGVLTLVAASVSAWQAVIAAVGLLVAAEIAACGARIYGAQSPAVVGIAARDTGTNLAWGAGAVAATAAVALAPIPTWLSVSALVVVVAVGFGLLLTRPDSRA